MASFKKILRKDNSSKSNTKSPQYKTSTTFLNYDISLIGALESDHDQILTLYKKILQKAREKDFASLQLTLVEFATAFTNHIQVEDERLYSYLKTLASTKSSVEQKVVAEFSSEMKNISISIFSFFSQSPCIPVKEDTVDHFIGEFKQMGALLEDRIEREEKILYPIYKNSRKVVNIT